MRHEVVGPEVAHRIRYPIDACPREGRRESRQWSRFLDYRSMSRLHASALAAVSVVVMLMVAGPALAQEDGPEIKGTLEAIDGELRDPVEGVTIRVAQDGAEIGSAVSDSNGDWVVPVPKQARIRCVWTLTRSLGSSAHRPRQE